MNFLDQHEKTLKRYDYLWHNEILDRCCISVTAPKDPDHLYQDNKPTSKEDLKRWYTDGEWIVTRNLKKIDHTYYAGDALPCIFPYFGTGGHAKYICPESNVEYEPDTIWIHPSIKDLQSYCYDFDPNTNPVFQQEKKLLEYFASEAKGRYFVGMPDNCGSYDALAQLRGNEELLIDLLTDPDNVKYAGKKIVQILKSSGDILFNAVKDNCCGGSFQGWMNLWAPGKLMQLQCDLSVMISPDIFREFIVDELTESSEWLDYAVYHMDGIEQIRHLDTILQIPKINMIQWVQVDGQPPATEYIPVLQKIQKSGRGLTIIISKHQIKDLLENLSPKGLNLVVQDASSPDEADRIVKLAETYR
ncbi:MAG: hypothetical protein ACOX60_07630 [Massiliimalia sp.]|jgi:hypothetical protein